MDEDTPFDNSMNNTQAMLAEKVSLIDRQLDINTLLTNLKMDMIGLEWDNMNKVLVRKKNAKPVITEEGADKLISNLKLYLEHPVVLGYLDDDEAFKFAEEYEINVTCQIAENSKDWEIKKVSDMDNFISASGTLVYCNLTRASGARTFNGIVSMAQLREVHTQATHEREVQQEKLGWKAKLKNMMG